MAFLARDSEDRERVHPLPQAIVVEVPDGGVDILRLIGRIVWFVEYEGANRVATRGGKVSLGTFNAEPRGEGNEGIVDWREVASASDVSRDEVVLL